MRMDQHCGYRGCCYQCPKEWHRTQLHQQQLPELSTVYCSGILFSEDGSIEEIKLEASTGDS